MLKSASPKSALPKSVLLKSPLLCAVALVAMAAPALAETATTADATLTPHYGRWGFDLAGRDLAVKPGQDFFRYANGGYVDRLQIPADRSQFGNFVVLSELSEARVRAILEAASAHAPEAATTAAGKIGAFYKAFMDEGRIEGLGTKPLERDLAAIRGVKDKSGLAALMGRSGDGYLTSIFEFGIGPDDKNPNQYVVGFTQGGLGLPDRDYYLTPQFATQKAKYQDYVAQMLGLIGWPDPAGNARAIVAMETAIAQASWTKAEQRDPEKTYNPVPVADLPRLAPGFAWTPFLQSADLGGAGRVIVAENTALPKIIAVYDRTPLETLKAWEAFHTADAAAPVLPRAFVDARFQFRSKVLSGQPQLQARWKRGVAQVDQGMGEAVGQVYVARYFPPEARAKMEALIADLKAAFAARIQRLDWMSPATKTQALDKLQRFSVKIGYPDKFRDYATLQVRADDAYGNAERAAAFDWRRQVARLNKPVDHKEWLMTPQTVNAYNNPEFNEVVFPAAILQPPFFDPDADAAINYGAIGGVIGHEMTHGFDDQGRKYDATGTLRDWWTKDDAARFDARAAKLGAQYSAFETLPGAHVNGALTMGENIADSGGVNLALDAYHASLHGKAAPVIDGLTGDQRVFLGWAQVWRGKVRDDEARRRLVTDPHSPDAARTDLPVRNVDAWYAAFDVKPGDKLYLAPADRVHIW